MFAQIIFLLGFLTIAILVSVFYLLTLQKLLEAISIQNRKLPPGQVWLMFIPVFNVVWHFVLVARIADSIRDECIHLNIPQQTARPTLVLGISSMILYLLAILFNTVSSSSLLIGGIFTWAALITWIVYWVKVGSYRKLILANQHNNLFDVEREGLNEITPQ